MKYVNLFVSCICLLIFRLEITLAYASTTSNADGPSPSLIKQAKELEIEPNVLMELWNSKQPVIVTKPDALGQLSRTTYELSTDGSAVTKTVSKENLPANSEQTPQPTPQPESQSISQQSPQQDWEYLPSTQTRRVPFPSFQPTSSFGGNFGTTFGANWPDFSTGFPSISRNWPSFSFPAGAVPETSTKTEVDDQGRTITTTTKIYRSNSDPNQVQPNLFSQPLPSWLQPNPARPQAGVPSYVPTTPSVVKVEPTYVPLPTVAPTNPSGLIPMTTTPFPSLDEFRRQQNSGNTLTNINLDDLPSVDDQGLPIFTSLNNAPSTQSRTRVTTYTSNFSGDSSPKISNLDPSAQDMLARAGITEEDIRNAPPSGIIEKTRTEPDGRVVTTRIRVNSSPKDFPTGRLPFAPLPTVKPYEPSNPFVPLPTVKPYEPSNPSPQDADKSIENYLSQVNLSPSDILAQNGEVVKTIVDKDGRVLSARFVLSTVKASENLDQKDSPTK